MAGWNDDELSGAAARGPGRSRSTGCGRRELERARDEACGECARVAGRAVLGERRERDVGEHVEDEHDADQRECRQPPPTGRTVGRVGVPGVATGSVATCSLDTLPPHTGARPFAALGPCSSASSGGPTPSS